ncbi:MULTISPECIES: tRNA (adenine-N1)-methyltransferase [unclassified Microcella]|uniref:tRNA (adenine-N1)-methyltransferase n=1 Tax=unclassified Microcella TaxID=2630066 RepID=UPI0006F7E331|nr:MULTISPECIES: tRNA (adenine-N1)-methyltransferase [unclassified Microcella]KQV25093.1 SAM-dependent methyltransferase [Yonghaparkia sp. Root332]KRF31377.1 SAM-dependent methyltransferase [Yonghaparkia sp. Soil809]
MTLRRQSGPFIEGDQVQLTDPKGRLNTVTLERGKAFHSHRGVLPHESLIGLPDGSVVENSSGVPYLALRPLLNDFVMSMPRGAAIVYPKDAGQIVAMGDVFPGATVVEAGVGSGALSLSLLRAIGPTGRLLSFERREEFADIARGNASAFLGEAPANWTITIGDLQASLPETCEDGTVDRVVLDMLAPWECLEAVGDALTPGGVLVVYVATATQLSRVAEAIRAAERFTEPLSSETMVRGWNVDGLSVRPDHRMVAHTGFLLTARRLADGTARFVKAKRGSKTEHGDEDVEIWTPGALGDRIASPKRLRKAVREAQSLAERSAKRAGDAPVEF